jgi:hypothetical protein
MKYSTGQYQTIDFEEWEVELFSVIGNALNMTLRILYSEDDLAKENRKGKSDISLLSISPLD